VSRALQAIIINSLQNLEFYLASTTFARISRELSYGDISSLTLIEEESERLKVKVKVVSLQNIVVCKLCMK
jgi:hypothetical protein